MKGVGRDWNRTSRQPGLVSAGTPRLRTMCTKGVSSIADIAKKLECRGGGDVLEEWKALGNYYDDAGITESELTGY